MSNYEKRILGKLAAEHGFIGDTLEKVYRCRDNSSSSILINYFGTI